MDVLFRKFIAIPLPYYLERFRVKNRNLFTLHTFIQSDNTHFYISIVGFMGKEFILFRLEYREFLPQGLSSFLQTLPPEGTQRPQHLP
eukprot:XP_001705973.1 Hypothetical protein GL50803_31729 [Giardia lamblia ATCC 50803]